MKWGRDARDERVEDWIRFYALYKNYLDRDRYEWSANLAIPTAYTVVEVQTAFLLDMINESGDFVAVLGKTAKGQVSANAVRELLNYHFRHSIDIYEDMMKFIRQLLILGTSVYKTSWRWQPQWVTRTVQKMDAFDPERVPETREVLDSELTYNQPDGYVVDMFNFGVDPNAEDMNNARFAFEEFWMDPIDLVEKFQTGVYKNVDKVLGAGSSNTNEGLIERLSAIGMEDNQRSPYVERGKIHLVDYWGYLARGWDYDGKPKLKKAQQQLYHVVLALPSSNVGYSSGEPVVLFARPSNFSHNKIPYVAARLNNCVGEFYGIGDIEYCEPLILEQRDMRNIFLDNQTRTMNKMFLYRHGANINKNELIWRPEGTIGVDDIEKDIKVLDVKGVDPASFKAMEDIKRDIEATTGVNDFITGLYNSSTGFNDTATGINLIQQVALKRLGHKGQVVQRAIKDIGHMMFSNIGQFQPRGTTVRILDRDSAIQARFIDVSPDALRNEYDFNIVSAPAIGSKQVRVQQLITIFQILLQSQQPGQPMPIPMDRFLKRLLDEMDVSNSAELMGHPNFNQGMPQGMGQGQMPGQGIEGAQGGAPEMGHLPEEENRLMVEQRKMVYPKIEEDHPQHLMVHQALFDSLLATSDRDSAELVGAHIEMHQKLSEQSKEMIAQAGAIDAVSEMALQQAGNLGALAQRGNGAGQNKVGSPSQGARGSSPTGAGGMESLVRSLGNFGAGNG